MNKLGKYTKRKIQKYIQKDMMNNAAAANEESLDSKWFRKIKFGCSICSCPFSLRNSLPRDFLVFDRLFMGETEECTISSHISLLFLIQLNSDGSVLLLFAPLFPDAHYNRGLIVRPVEVQLDESLLLRRSTQNGSISPTQFVRL